jgi:hypothetical protein
MFYIIAILAVIFAMPAKADETLKYRIVQHYASNQNQQVGDVERHVVGFARLVGIAFFPDGSIGSSVVIATYDTVAPSSGALSGYNTITFNDGSELRFKWSGSIVSFRPFFEKGTTTVVSGKGRYEGAKGEGTWEMPTTIGSGTDAIQVLDIVLNIKK